MAVLATVSWFARRFVYLALAVAATVVLVACGSTAVTSTGPTLVKCALTLSGPDGAVSSSGGSSQVVLTTTPECAWTATADTSSVAQIEPSSGQGSATLRVDVVPNPSTSMRMAAIVVNGVRAQIQQAPAPCTYAISGNGNQAAGPGGGPFQITVSTGAGCAWEATSAASWVRVASGAGGSGPGVVQFAVDPNPGDARVAALTIAGQPFVVNQAAAVGPPPPGVPACTYSLSPGATPVPAAGGAGLLVSLTTACPWTAATNVPWITITSPAGSGNGSITFTVAPNSGSARSGAITVGSATATINQAAVAPCSFGLNSTTFYVASSAGNDSLAVTTAASCSWTAVSNASWITVTSGGSGSGNGTVAFGWAANTSGSRIGTLTVAGQTVTVSQADRPPDCSAITANPLSFSIADAGATGQLVNVTAESGCSWAATANAPWITITSGASGSGSGPVRFNVAANTGGARNGTLTVAGQTVTVSQANKPPDCSAITANPLSFSIAAAGATGQTVNVTAENGCQWTAGSNAPWITLTAGASGSGSGPVRFNVAANTGGARNSTLTVAGRTVTVSQAAAPAPCSYNVTPAKVSIPGNGGPGPGITVTAGAGCAWTATTSTPWLTITSGAAGTGNGTVAFSAGQNNGGARSGSLLVAGQTVTVDQEARCVYNVTVMPRSFRDEGGTATATVMTAAGCPWTISSDRPWIVVPPPGNRSGPGTVSITIQANPGNNRDGHVTVAGETFEIQQSKN